MPGRTARSVSPRRRRVVPKGSATVAMCSVSGELNAPCRDGGSAAALAGSGMSFVWAAGLRGERGGKPGQLPAPAGGTSPRGAGDAKRMVREVPQEWGCFL